MLCSFAYVNDSHAYVEANAPGVFLLLSECFGSTYLRSIRAFGSFRTSRPSSAEWTEGAPLIRVREVSNFSSKGFNRRERSAGGRIFHLTQTLTERRFLPRPHLSGHGFTGGDVPGDARHPAHGRLARTVAGDGHRPGTKNHASTPNLCRPLAPRVANLAGGPARVRRRKENEPSFAETCVIAASRHEQSCLDFNCLL